MTPAVSRYSLIILLGVIAYLSYLTIRPFLSYLIFSAVLVMLFIPLYDRLVKRFKRPRIASLLLVVGLIVLLIVPSLILGYHLVQQAPTAYEQFAQALNAEELDQFVNGLSPVPIDTSTFISQTVVKFRSYILSEAGTALTGAANIAIGLFIMFFVMYYLFIEGRTLLEQLTDIIPLSTSYTNALIVEINQVVHGTIQGQLVLGLLQGVLGGVMFWVLGLPNPMFWGFLMVIASIIPLIGSFIIWLPASLWLIVTGEITQGVILLIFGVIVISQIDNFLRPYIVGRVSAIHPVIVLVGVLGGLKMFGVIGFITGPLILALFVQLMQFFAKMPLHKDE